MPSTISSGKLSDVALRYPTALAVAACLLAAYLLAACTSRGGRLKAEMPEPVYIDPPSAAAVTRGTDSVTLRATDMYAAGGWRRFLHGRKYRDAWQAPVTVPVAWLDTLKGGLRPDDMGGGFQTLSLDLVDAAGVTYTIRSVTKNPHKLVKPWMKLFGIRNLVIDGIAAGHPYGAMVMPALSDAAGVRHFNPKLYYLPAQSALDTFNERFGGSLYWLEYEPEGPVPAAMALPRAEDYDDSEKVLEKWRANPTEDVPNLRALVRARVFDLWVGDWDRHDGQWGWVQYDAGDGKRSYYPIPNDRDNVFYGIDGFYPGIVRLFEKRLQPFGPKIKNVDGLTSNSAWFDYAFLYDVPAQTFVDEAKSLQAALTDEVIEEAMHEWPPAVYAEDGDRIVRDLKKRRGDLVDYALEFHRVIRDRGEVDYPHEDDDD